MTKPKKKWHPHSEDEKHPLDAESSEKSELLAESEVASEVSEEIPSAAPVAEESKKISGSPIGKIRGKDLQWQK